MQTRWQKRRRIDPTLTLLPFIPVLDVCQLILQYDTVAYFQQSKQPLLPSITLLPSELKCLQENHQWPRLCQWYMEWMVDLLYRAIHALHTTQWSLPLPAPDPASYAKYKRSSRFIFYTKFYLYSTGDRGLRAHILKRFHLSKGFHCRFRIPVGVSTSPVTFRQQFTKLNLVSRLGTYDNYFTCCIDCNAHFLHLHTIRRQGLSRGRPLDAIQI